MYFPVFDIENVSLGFYILSRKCEEQSHWWGLFCVFSHHDRFPKGERRAIFSESWSGEVSLNLHQHWLLCCSDAKQICFICLLRKINKDDIVILDSLNYIKGKFQSVHFCIIFIYAFMFKTKIFCRLQIWAILSHQARSDPPLSGEHPWCFKLKISTLEPLKSCP